jgi:hypothetical protein
MGVLLPVRVAINSGVLWQMLDTECVVLNLATRRYLPLDEACTRMWQLLDRHGDVETVVGHLAVECDGDESTLRRDLADLIRRLAEAEVVTVS